MASMFDSSSEKRSQSEEAHHGEFAGRRRSLPPHPLPGARSSSADDEAGWPAPLPVQRGLSVGNRTPRSHGAAIQHAAVSVVVPVPTQIPPTPQFLQGRRIGRGAAAAPALPAEQGPGEAPYMLDAMRTLPTLQSLQPHMQPHMRHRDSDYVGPGAGPGSALAVPTYRPMENFVGAPPMRAPFPPSDEGPGLLDDAAAFHVYRRRPEAFEKKSRHPSNRSRSSSSLRSDPPSRPASRQRRHSRPTSRSRGSSPERPLAIAKATPSQPPAQQPEQPPAQPPEQPPVQLLGQPPVQPSGGGSRSAGGSSGSGTLVPSFSRGQTAHPSQARSQSQPASTQRSLSFHQPGEASGGRAHGGASVHALPERLGMGRVSIRPMVWKRTGGSIETSSDDSSSADRGGPPRVLRSPRFLKKDPWPKVPSSRTSGSPAPVRRNIASPGAFRVGGAAGSTSPQAAVAVARTPNQPRQQSSSSSTPGSVKAALPSGAPLVRPGSCSAEAIAAVRYHADAQSQVQRHRRDESAPAYLVPARQAPTTSGGGGQRVPHGRSRSLPHFPSDMSPEIWSELQSSLSSAVVALKDRLSRSPQLSIQGNPRGVHGHGRGDGGGRHGEASKKMPKTSGSMKVHQHQRSVTSVVSSGKISPGAVQRGMLRHGDISYSRGATRQLIRAVGYGSIEGFCHPSCQRKVRWPEHRQRQPGRKKVQKDPELSEEHREPAPAG